MAAAAKGAPAPVLSVSIVTYRVDEPAFRRTLDSLDRAVEKLALPPPPVHVKIVDNGGQESRLQRLVEGRQSPSVRYEVIGGIRNIGYGRAHNLAILTSKARYHLILNPDVILEEDCLAQGIGFLAARQDLSAAAPFATDADGKVQYLCKNFPNVLDLSLRGFAPAFLKRRFQARLAGYELRERLNGEVVDDVPLISGCFMLCDARKLKLAGGFDERFFLYFEDFALSMELKKQGPLAYLPHMKIRHFGGNSARKGPRHILMFITSGIKFFNIYGWKFR